MRRCTSLLRTSLLLSVLSEYHSISMNVVNVWHLGRGCEKTLLNVPSSPCSDAVRVLHPREASVVRVRGERRGGPLHQVPLAARQEVRHGHRQPHSGMYMTMRRRKKSRWVAARGVMIPDLEMDFQPFGNSGSGSSRKWNRNTSTCNNIISVSQNTNRLKRNQ